MSPDGAHVYVVAARAEGPSVHAFRRAPDGTTMAIASPTLVALDDAGRLSLTSSADGRHLYAGIGSDQLVTFARDASTGSLTQLEVRHDVSSRLTSSPEGRSVYALFPSLLATYARDEATGLLTRIDLENGATGPAAFDNALAVVVSPDGRHVYLGSAGTTPGAVGDVGPSLIVFARDPATGALEPVETIRDGQNGVTGIALPANLAVSPDGRHVYASGGSDDVATFARDLATGELAFLGVAAGGGFTSDDYGGLAVSPDGERLIVAGGALGGTCCARDGFTIFGREPRSGVLTLLETLSQASVPAEEDLAGPTSVAFAPDGRDVYVTAALDSALTAYRVLPHCAAEPVTGCSAGHSRIVLRHGPTDTVSWTWRTGATSSAADFGDPRTTTDYALCVHRADAGEWTNVLQLRVPAASTCGATATPCWHTAGRPSGSSRYVFRDAAWQHDGVAQLLLTSRAGGRASILLRGRGAGLALPPLPLGPADLVVAQLRTGDGDCWSATYAAPARRDDGGHFSDQD